MKPTEAVEVEVIDIPLELAVFDPVALAIEKAKAKNESLVFEYDTKDGNKQARSWIAELRKLKAPLNEIHKQAKAEALKFTKALDAKKNEYLEVIVEMINVHYEPIRAIEEAEAAKKAEVERVAREKEEAEEEKARLELETRENAIREERKALEKEKAEIEKKAREAHIALEAKRRAEADAKQAAIDADNKFFQAEEKAKADLRIAENKRLADIQKEKDKAIAEAEVKERLVIQEQRVERARQEEAEAAEQMRIADKDHRLKIHTEIYKSLQELFVGPEADPQSEIWIKSFTRVLIDRKIPHVTIQY